MEAPVETINKRTEVTGSVLGEIERMLDATHAGFEVAQHRVDPIELRQVFGLAGRPRSWPCVGSQLRLPRQNRPSHRK